MVIPFIFKISSVSVKNCIRGHKIINLAIIKVLIFKTLITSKLIDSAT